jgi:hypothetical protein
VVEFDPATLTHNVVLSIKANNSITTPLTFTVALSNPTGNATLGSPSSITITILRSYHSTYESLDLTYNIIGTIITGFTTMVPHIIRLIVAFIPLIIIGSIIAAMIAIVAILPRYVRR